MHRQVGDLLIDESGIAEKGLLVRHLVMPNDVSNTKEVMTFLADKISEDTYVNVMDQYHPCGKATFDPAINRRLTRKEYVEAVRLTKRGRPSQTGFLALKKPAFEKRNERPSGRSAFLVLQVVSHPLDAVDGKNPLPGLNIFRKGAVGG